MIDKIKNSPLNLQSTSVYNFNDFSLTELLNKFFTTINQCVDSSNTSLQFLTWLKGEGLPTEVEKEIQKMYDDGRITDSINNLNSELNNKINVFENDINNEISQINNKINSTNTDLTTINSELEYNIKIQNQENFLETLKEYNCFKDKFSIVCNNTNPLSISIFHELLNNKIIGYSLYKHSNDDFLLFGSCRYGDKNYSYVDLKRENYENKTGEWTIAETSEAYTKEIDATFTKSYTGYGIDFQCRTDTRGGIWEFVIDGDITNKVVVSTWNSSIEKKIIPIIRDTEIKTHTIVATFKGQDPAQSYTEEPRGWTYFSETTGTTTFIIKDYRPGILNPIILIPEISNKEFAISCRKQGSDYDYQFIPLHANIPSSRNKIPPKFYIDGVEKTQWTEGESYFNISNFQVVQNVYGYNIGENNLDLMEINTSTSFDKYGVVNINGKIKSLVDLDINIGYGLMFPISTNYCNRIVTGIKNSYPTIKTDYSNTFLEEESDNVTSYISINDNSLNNLGIICNYNSPLSTLRKGMEGKPKDKGKMCRIEHRDSNMQKFYQIIFQNYNMPSGETFRFSGTFKVIDMKNLNNLI